MSLLWGPNKNLDYWAALRLGVVPPPERRAMALLASLSDEKRFSFYCLSGQFPAMGNTTKRIYLVRRWTTILELEDGVEKSSWCINTDDRSKVPETDHVVVMRNLIEGSELDFREIGNESRYSRRSYSPKDNRFPNPYYGEVGRDMDPSPSYRSWYEKYGAMDETKRLRKDAIERAERFRERTLYWRYKLTRKALEEKAKQWTCLPEKPKMVKIDQAVLDRLLTNQRIVAIDNSSTGFTSANMSTNNMSWALTSLSTISLA